MTESRISASVHRDDFPVPDFSMVMALAVHDMKNSLGMLLNTVEDLRQEHQKTLGDNRHINTLQYEAERVHSDLVQLLGIYRMGEHKLSAHTDEHYLREFLGEQVARNEPLLRGYGIDYEIAADENTTGFFDEELVAGVITSTLNNAIRYTRGRIRLRARQENDWLVISIEDDGNGYPEQMIAAGEAVLKTPDFSTGSTSLGLYFAAAIARLHHNQDKTGSIRISNGGALGGGIFELWLP